MINIKITRNAILWDHAYRLTIFIDGKKIGKMCGDETRVFTIPLESKLIYGRMYWGAKTRSFSLDDISNQTHLVFKKYKASSPLINLGITGYPLEIFVKSNS